MNVQLKIKNGVVFHEMLTALAAARIEYRVNEGSSVLFHQRGLPSPKEIIVALGSLGTFGALRQVLREVVTRHKEREIIVKLEKNSVTIKGHMADEELRILESFFRETHNLGVKNEPTNRP